MERNSQQDAVVVNFVHKLQAKGQRNIANLMADAEKLDMILRERDFPVEKECHWVTCIANLPSFQPVDALQAEVQVNSLLSFMSSNCCFVRALACSLLRNFSQVLNPSGEHITTQVTIICKNLITTLFDSLDESVRNKRFLLCQVIACSSLCFIASSWSEKLTVPRQRMPFVWVTISTAMSILGPREQDIHPLLYQVASDGLCKVLHVTNLWACTLIAKERSDLLNQLMDILAKLLEQVENSEAWSIAKLGRLLAVFNNKDLILSIMDQPATLSFLLQNILHVLQPRDVNSMKEGEVPLQLRWTALGVVWQFLHAMGLHESMTTEASIKAVFDKACFGADQYTELKLLLQSACTEYASRKECAQITV